MLGKKRLEGEEVQVKTLRYITDKLAKWEYLPIDEEGKIRKGGMTWSVIGSEPDFLIGGDMGEREPFFILRNDIAVPVNVGKIGTEDEENPYNPFALTQLIDNQNLRFMTKIPVEKFSRARLFLLLAVGVAFGMTIMFAVMKILNL